MPQEFLPGIRNAIEALRVNPRTIHTEKLEGSPNVYRLRVGSYRVVYTIEDHLQRVVVYRLAHRREVYR